MLTSGLDALICTVNKSVFNSVLPFFRQEGDVLRQNTLLQRKLGELVQDVLAQVWGSAFTNVTQTLVSVFII